MPYLYDRSASRVRVALIQVTGTQKVVAAIQAAASKGANVVCLQELFAGPYFPQTSGAPDTSEPVPGPTTARLSSLAAAHGIVIIGSVYERDETRRFNTAVILDADGSLVGKYRKSHIPQDPYFREQEYFEPGDTGFVVASTKFGKIGTIICWDQWFPEAVRALAVQGAKMVFCPTSIGVCPLPTPTSPPQEVTSWMVVQRGHAISNGIFYAAVNRVGREGAITFWGSSFVADPYGRLMVKASATEENIVLADCDLSLVDAAHYEWPFLKARRPDLY